VVVGERPEGAAFLSIKCASLAKQCPNHGLLACFFWCLLWGEPPDRFKRHALDFGFGRQARPVPRTSCEVGGHLGPGLSVSYRVNACYLEDPFEVRLCMERPLRCVLVERNCCCWFSNTPDGVVFGFVYTEM